MGLKLIENAIGDELVWNRCVACNGPELTRLLTEVDAYVRRFYGVFRKALPLKSIAQRFNRRWASIERGGTYDHIRLVAVLDLAIKSDSLALISEMAVSGGVFFCPREVLTAYFRMPAEIRPPQVEDIYRGVALGPDIPL